MSCPKLAVPTEVMQHVARIESGGNRFAIGVVGGRLERQPRNLGEAVATARMLESKGYDYSLGIAQVNRRNLARYGLDTFEKAFDGCANATAGARILAKCYGRSGGDWGKAFSCYYSGNFTTGYRDGYVQRVFASFGAGLPDSSEAITVRPRITEHPGGVPTVGPASIGSPAYRVSIRSVAIDTTTGALVSPMGEPRSATENHPPEGAGFPRPAEAVESPQSAFVPHVTGPGDAPDAEAQPTAPTTGRPVVSEQEQADAAFVF
ncbi:lytic transglycosylase domain-containing protein [Frateuria soli]|nr:lytic transglycosylase domain-containing protein [Frateuria soli]UGB39804.1 lytic transglycosylase domain-containing protein [Frateuria soli]